MPIWIGQSEAVAMNVKLEDKQFPRPMTHDLFINTLGKFGIKISRMVVNDLRETTFYARIIFEREDVREEVDARPSDAIALALRAKAPIFVSEDVLEKSMARDDKGEPVPLEEAKEKFRNETDFNKKIENTKKKLEEEPDSVELYCTLGDLYLRKAFVSSPDPKRAFINEEMLDAAMGEFKRGLRLGAKGDFKFISHNRLGVIYLKKKMLGKAEEEEEEALKVDPNGWEAHFVLSAIHAEKEDKERAIKSLEKITEFIGEGGALVSTKPLQLTWWFRTQLQQEFKKIQKDTRFQEVCSQLGFLGSYLKIKTQL